MKPVRRKPVRRCWTEEAAAITLQALCRGHLVCIFVEQVRAARARAVAARAEAVAAEAAAVAAKQRQSARYPRESNFLMGRKAISKTQLIPKFANSSSLTRIT
jgi:hypothetical protein